MPETTEPTDESGSRPEASASVPAKETLLERLFAPRSGPAAKSVATDDVVDRTAQGSQKPRPQRSTNPGSEAPTTKWQVDRIDKQERRFGYAAAAGSLIFAVMIYLVEVNNKNFHPVKNQFSPQTALIVGVVAAVLLVGGTYVGRRAPLGFIALFTGFTFSNSGGLFLALPFLLLAGLLLWRSYRSQKRANAAAREARTAGGSAPAPVRERPTRAGGSRKAKAPTGPEANKRYTPKRPTQPAPPPPKLSWIERRAAKEAEQTKG